MRAVRIHQLTGPKAVRIDDIEVPPAPDANQVKFEVKAAGINFPEVLLTYGKYQFKPDLPFVPGGEAAGVVTAVGSEVTSIKVGDRVAATMLNGAFAEQVVVPELACVKVPEKVGFETAGVTLLAYGTTMHALKDRAQLKAGETLLVLGAGGGVGMSAIQLGKAMGAKVIAAAAGEQKLKFCAELGADMVVDYDKEDLKERVKALTNGDGANVIVDAVGGRYSEPALRAIAWEGRHLVIGFAAGEIPKIPLNLALLKGCQIVGVYWGFFALKNPERNRANCAEVLQWVAEGRIKPHVHAVMPFAKAVEALELMEQRKVFGKLALVP